jgi:TetR/AcrR family transcriptional regulator, transcriptional repressor of aconitase
VPKLTSDLLRARRAGIIEAAQRVFARYGYDGATVVRLEQETGLSRGAIFHYFADKTDIFVAVALGLTTRFVDLIVERGIDEAVRSMAEEDPTIIWAILEVRSRLRHDSEFQRRLGQRDENRGRLLTWFAEQQSAGLLRSDLDPASLSRYVTIILNGIAADIAVGNPVDIAPTLELLHTGLTKDG